MTSVKTLKVCVDGIIEKNGDNDIFNPKNVFIGNDKIPIPEDKTIETVLKETDLINLINKNIVIPSGNIDPDLQNVSIDANEKTGLISDIERSMYNLLMSDAKNKEENFKNIVNDIKYKNIDNDTIIDYLNNNKNTLFGFNNNVPDNYIAIINSRQTNGGKRRIRKTSKRSSGGKRKTSKYQKRKSGKYRQ